MAEIEIARITITVTGEDRSKPNMWRVVMTVAELEQLPTGAIIIDNEVPDAPAVACKTGLGDWQVLGGDPDRRWWSHEMFPDDHSQSFLVVYNPSTL